MTVNSLLGDSPSPDLEHTSRTPTIAVLTMQWTTNTEASWFLRQVAGALACSGEVHILTLQGDRPREYSDSVFRVHELATMPSQRLLLRRDFLLGALADDGALSTRPGTRVDSFADQRLPKSVSTLLEEGFEDPWEVIVDPLARLQPDLVVIADFRDIEASRVAERTLPSTPCLLVPLAGEGSVQSMAHFDPVFERCTSVVVATEAEGRAIESGRRVPNLHVVGLPLAANPSMWREPNTFVGDTDYVTFIAEDSMIPSSGSEALISLLRLRFPDNPVAVVAKDTFTVWHRGAHRTNPPVGQGSDLARLLAWGTLTIDMRPGRLFARRCVESLLYATPILIPSHTRGRQLAEVSGGGLWFDGPADFLWCAEAMLHPRSQIRDELASQGNCYATDICGSTDSFVNRVMTASGLLTEATPVAGP